jgi:hypothetical protein
MRRFTRWLFTAAILLALGRTGSASTIIVSNGYVTPETISQIPAGFGQLGGGFFVTDAGTGQIMLMPLVGAAPSTFQTVTNQSIRGGLFLPSGFGSFAGQFIVVGRSNGTNNGEITAYDANGNATLFGGSSTSPGFIDPAIAPSGFGTLGGNLFVSDGRGLSYFDQSASFSPFVPDLGFSGSNASFGVAFAPSGFGSVGGTLLVDSAGGVNGQSEIFSVDSTANVTPFATLNLLPGQVGLRQMAFAPANFGPYGGSLFVSVSGSVNGGGTLGAVDVLDSNGKVEATLNLGTNFNKFDPRGLTFLPGGDLLIADASDPILLATPSDFTPVPEPEGLSVIIFCSIALLTMPRFRTDQKPEEREIGTAF